MEHAHCLVLWALSSRSFADAAGSAPVRQSVEMNSGFSRATAMFFHRVNWPVSTINAVAGRQGIDEGRFPAPVPVAGINDDRVRGLEDGLDAFERALGELGNSTRWPMIGVSMARRMRPEAGSPGICGNDGRRCEEFLTWRFFDLWAKSAFPPCNRRGRRSWPP
jgi:hypothetical protein